MRKTIFVLFGEEGAGKKTLITEAISQVPELVALAPRVSTAARKDNDLPYREIADNDLGILSPQQLFTFRFEGRSYIVLKDELDTVLQSHAGLMIAEQDTIKRVNKIRGYEFAPVFVQPCYRTLTPEQSEKVRMDDRFMKPNRMSARKKIINSFKPGGKERAVELLIKFIRGYTF